MQAILPLFGVAGLIGKKLLDGPGRPPTPLPAVTRDTAAEKVATDDELHRRKGAAGDILNGSGGAEAVLTGGKLTLGS